MEVFKEIASDKYVYANDDLTIELVGDKVQLSIEGATRVIAEMNYYDMEELQLIVSKLVGKMGDAKRAALLKELGR